MTFPCVTNETGLASKACAETSNLAEFGPKGLSVGLLSSFILQNIVLLFYIANMKAYFALGAC